MKEETNMESERKYINVAGKNKEMKKKERR
jgi:hypothetical protein